MKNYLIISVFLLTGMLLFTGCGESSEKAQVKVKKEVEEVKEIVRVPLEEVETEEEVSSEDEDTAGELINEVAVLIEKNKISEAELKLNDVLALKNHMLHGWAYRIHAEIFIRQERLKEAEKFYKKAIEYRNLRDKLLGMMGIVELYYKLDDHKSAGAYIDQLKRIDPGDIMDKKEFDEEVKTLESRLSR